MAYTKPSRRDVLKLGAAALGTSVLGVPAAASSHQTHPNARFALDFSDSAHVAPNTAGSAGWVTDRYAPATFTTWEMNGEDTLRVKPDASGATSGFSAYQGKKYLDAGGAYWHAGDGSRFSYDFFIDGFVWSGEPVRTGFWPTLGDASGAISAYPIMEYRTGKASDGNPGFYAYVYESDENGDFAGAKWEYIGLPKKLKIDPSGRQWVTIEAQLHELDDGMGSALKWRINNKLVLDERNYNVFSPSTQFLEFILNTRNYGETGGIISNPPLYYDNMVLTEPR
ncbi:MULTISPECIES: hypothetical protein [Haloferax]|uniref:Uncharacterized protein n=1 Tax=Haloferax marinum TaxID=2666143 RepID=A0A6A8GAZ9_9EURY|nr:MULTISPECIES: hypothetical protein [Haloferax]KAB1198795.1 hypothetical protein Hfx1150_15195 [Haloferax sp. CBA1150]MRW97915.1 hypothetical protein [Haloferax marinum]